MTRKPYFSSKQQSFIRLALCISSCNHRALPVFVIPAASYCFIAKASLKIVYPEMSLQNTDNLGFIYREPTEYKRELHSMCFALSGCIIWALSRLGL